MYGKSTNTVCSEVTALCLETVVTDCFESYKSVVFTA